MTDKFIPPPPSDEVLHRLDAGEREMFATEFSVGDCMRAGRMMREALAAAFAHDLPRVCRAEVEEMLDVIVVGHPWRGCGCYQCVNYRLYLTERYGPASDGPAPGPVQTPPDVADVVALHTVGAVTVVVNGVSVSIAVQNAASAIDEVLRRTANVGRPPQDWEMRNVHGNVLPLGSRLVAGQTYYVNLRAGMGGKDTPPCLCQRPETRAFLRDVAMENQYLGSARRFLDATREAE